MKIILSIVALAMLQVTSSAQETAGNATARSGADPLVLKEKSYDFGVIQQGRPVKHNFEIINQGTDTLRLDDVHASCGCTTPVWKREGIAPNGTTVIEVGYNAADEGPFEKTINIFYNNGKVKPIVIRGKVYKAASVSAPPNASIRLLKQKMTAQNGPLN